MLESSPGRSPATAASAPDLVRLRFSIKDSAGSEVDAGVIEFAPGIGETFPWLEEAAEGMNPGAKRTAEVPADLSSQVLRDATSRTLSLEIERLE